MAKQLSIRPSLLDMIPIYFANWINSALLGAAHAINTYWSRPYLPSLDTQANERIQRSLSESETFLITGSYRAAVQEILWLLETISTAFQGAEYPDGNITGKYFNKIIGDLRRFNRDRTLSRVVDWMENMHGYLSSPGGGGIRHGALLNENVEITEIEARLYCDLTRSYI